MISEQDINGHLDIWIYYSLFKAKNMKSLRSLNTSVWEVGADVDVCSAEHFVFPEDRPAEEQREVRTVEEESLFRVAYPEQVETYLRHKALAEENKTKSKTEIYDIHFKCTKSILAMCFTSLKHMSLLWQGHPDQGHLHLKLASQHCLLKQLGHIQM